MSWRIAWHPAALHGLYTLRVKTAERLDAAVLRLAAGHVDEAERLPDSRLLLLRVPGAAALVSADRRTGLIFVLRAFPRR